MPPGAHVLDVYVDQPRRPALDHRIDRAFALAVQMTHIEREAKVFHARLGKQFFPAVHCIDEHARLRLKADGDMPSGGVFERLTQALDEPRQRVIGRNGLQFSARPERDAVALQGGGHVDGMFVEVEPRAGVLAGRG